MKPPITCALETEMMGTEMAKMGMDMGTGEPEICSAKISCLETSVI